MPGTILLYRGNFFNANFTYHSGIDIDHSFLILKGNKKTLLVPRMNLSIAEKNFKGKVIAYKNPYESLKKMLSGTEVAADLSAISARGYRYLSSFCTMKDYTEELLCMRMEKQRSEVQKLRKAAKLTQELISSVEITPGMRENEIRSKLLINMMERGFDPSFEPIISSGKNTAYPHSTSTKKKVKEFVLIDCGIRYQGYCGDITRCIFLDRSSKAMSAYENTRNVCMEIVDNLPDMKTGKNVASFAERVIKRNGLPKLIHSIGHGIGLAVHEYPRLNKKYEDPIKNSVFTIEPGTYFSSFGVRHEEMIHFNGKKARIL